MWKIFRNFVLLSITFFSLFLWPSFLLSKEIKKVLIIHSYHSGFEWTDGIQSGIKDVLETYRFIELFIEYMDLIRNVSDETYLNVLERLYEIKYKSLDKKPDVIMLVDDDALNFVLNRRDVLFKNIPLVFCGINDFDKKRIKGVKNITGVNEKKSIKETVELAVLLSRNPKKIGVISGERLSEQINLAQFKKAIKSIKHNLEVVYLNGLELDDIQKKISQFDKDDILIFLSYLRSPAGKVYGLDEVLRVISSSTKAKIFATNDIQIKHGIIGGKVVYSYSQGEEAAKMVVKILNGVSPDRIPILMESPNKYLFDGESLKKYNISISSLPKGSIIINKASEHHMKEWKELITSSSFFSYEFFMKHGTVMLIIEPATGIILDANENAKLFYGYPELIGKKIQEINTLTEEEVKREMEKAKTTKKNFFNFKHRLHNGDIRDVEVYSYPIKIKDKTLLFSIIFDVTDKLKAHQLKMEKEKLLFYSMIALIIALILFSILLVLYIIKRKSYEKNLMEKNKRLEEAHLKIRILSGIIPICMHCKKIRDDQGYWNQLEKFISEHSEVIFSHSLCPDCKEKHYENLTKK